MSDQTAGLKVKHHLSSAESSLWPPLPWQRSIFRQKRHGPTSLKTKTKCEREPLTFHVMTKSVHLDWPLSLFYLTLSISHTNPLKALRGTVRNDGGDIGGGCFSKILYSPSLSLILISFSLSVAADGDFLDPGVLLSIWSLACRANHESSLFQSCTCIKMRRIISNHVWVQIKFSLCFGLSVIFI